jgi:septal ring factor EnvC (AmiA/AmiB activator)
MEQYNNPPTEGTINLPKVTPTTRTQTDRQIDALESKIAEQGQELLKLRRDLGRLKNDIADIINMIKSRG